MKLVWNRDSGVLAVVGEGGREGGGVLSPPLCLCLCLCLLGLVGRALPSLTSPSPPVSTSLSLSRLKISRRRGGCRRGCSVSRITAGELELELELELVVEGEVGANVGKKGVVVVGGSVDTMLSEMVGRNTDEVSASKLTSSSSSEL